jgi:hypothetical protein
MYGIQFDDGTWYYCDRWPQWRRAAQPTPFPTRQRAEETQQESECGGTICRLDD